MPSLRGNKDGDSAHAGGLQRKPSQEFASSEDGSLRYGRRGASEYVLRVPTFSQIASGAYDWKDGSDKAGRLENPRLVKKLTFAYIACMLIVGLLALAGQIIVQVWVDSSYDDSRIVNEAGLQRMLCQQISKDALALQLLASRGQNATFYIAELRTAVTKFQKGQADLIRKRDDVHIPHTPDKEIRNYLADLQPLFDELVTSAMSILTVLAAERKNISSAAISAQVNNILLSEVTFLHEMDILVGVYASRGKDHLHTLLIITWVTTSIIIVTIIIEGLAVIRPILASMLTLVEERFDLLRASLAAEATAREVSLLVISYVSHELQEPLSSMMRRLKKAGSLLKEKYGSQPPLVEVYATCKAVSEILKEAQESCRVMNTVVEDVSDLRKLEGGKLRVVLTTTRLGPILKRAIETVKAKEHVSLTYTLNSGTEDLDFTCDKHRLQQVLVNFIGNALKFTKAGSVELVASVAVPSSVRFDVIDTGDGLTEEAKAKVFMPFFGTPDKSNLRGGTGLGLSIAKLLVELMGGSCGVISTPGGGSTFWFQLPITPTFGTGGSTNRSIHTLDGRHKGSGGSLRGFPSHNNLSTSESSTLPQLAVSGGHAAGEEPTCHTPTNGALEVVLEAPMRETVVAVDEEGAETTTKAGGQVHRGGKLLLSPRLVRGESQPDQRSLKDSTTSAQHLTMLHRHCSSDWASAVADIPVGGLNMQSEMPS
eukprot:SM000013S26429  [mRNA]  locus=s13:328822:334099:- [translate_table: standard]